MKKPKRDSEDQLSQIEEKLDKIEKLWKMPKEDVSDVLRITGLLADATVNRDGKELNSIIKEVRALGPQLDDKLDDLKSEAHKLKPKEGEKIREQIDRLDAGKNLLLIEERMKRLRPELRKYVSDLLAMRIFPIYVKKPTLAVRLTTPIQYKNKMRKPKENPVYQLDSYLLDKVASHLGPALFIVPAFSMEHEFANHGHLVAITPSEKYLPEPSEKVIPLKKKAQELTEEEIEKLKEKTGHHRVVLVVKGINTILGKDEMEELIRKINPDAIAVYGTWHEERPNFEGVPKIDKNILELTHRMNYEDVTKEIFKEDELKRINELEKRIGGLIEPWAKYFPATRVRVFRRRRP